MRDDYADVRAALEGAGKDQIDDGTVPVEDLFDDEGRRSQVRLRRRFAVGRMDKDNCLAPMKLVEDGIK